MGHASTDTERAAYAERQFAQADSILSAARESLASAALGTTPFDHLAASLNAVARAQAVRDVWGDIAAMASSDHLPNYDGLLWSLVGLATNDNYSGSGQEATRAYADARRQAVLDARWALGLA
jgi:hypothetical protein